MLRGQPPLIVGGGGQIVLIYTLVFNICVGVEMQIHEITGNSL